MKLRALMMTALLASSFNFSAKTVEAFPHEPTRSGAALDALIADIHTSNMSFDPISASLEGDAEAARHLPIVSIQATHKQAQANSRFMARYKALPVEGMNEFEQLNYQLLGFVLGQSALSAKMDGGRIPFTNDSGFYSNLTYMTQQIRFDSAQDYASYTDRLKELPRFFEQHQNNMRRGIKAGFTAPAEIMPSVITGVENLTAIAPEDHPLAAPFMDVNTRLPEPLRAEIKRQGLETMDTIVMPAYRRLLNFMETDYLPKARPNIGLSSLPGGAAQYEALVKYYTTLDITPDEVHALGLTEVARIREQMDAIIVDTKFEGSFADFLNFLRTDPQFYAKSREELLMHAAWIAKRVDGKMPEYFKTLPRLPYGVMAVPTALEQNYTTGRYFSGNAKQGKAGNYVVNTYDLKQRPLYNLPALTLHEGVPGHHHQISLAAEQEGVPQFRQDLYPHAYGEGWGLYAEKLGEEMGIYRTPYERFGRLTYEMWRACRLVMDTGMHYKGWSRERAQACPLENSALSPHNVKTETERYISWPGQALAYKMGELKIVELRARAEAALGNKFDIREFHDAVLVDGAMPLGILEARIDSWIRTQQESTPAQIPAP